MSDFRYLDYEGLTTYTEQVKDFVNSKIVYLEDESQIPDPPVEGTLYVVGSNILMDEEIIIGTHISSVSEWTGNSIDTQLYNGKRIVYWLPYSGNNRPQTLNLTFSDENNTQSGAISIYKYGNTILTNEYPAGTVIRMIYLENVEANGSIIPKGWWCDADQGGGASLPTNNVTGSGTNNYIAKFNGTNTITSGPAFGTATTTYLRNDGSWAVPYTHPTTSGNRHIPSGGATNQYLKYSADGTAYWNRPYVGKTALAAAARPAAEIVSNTTISIPAYSWCHVRAMVTCPNTSPTGLVSLEYKLANATTPTTAYYIGHSTMSNISNAPGECELWYYNNTSSTISALIYIRNPNNIEMNIATSYTYGGRDGSMSPASYYEIIS